MKSAFGLRSRTNKSQFSIEKLECRVTPSSGFYTPPSHFQVNPAHDQIASRVGQQPLDIALTYLNQNAALFSATPADLVNPIVTGQHTDPTSGITFMYLRQQVNGLPVLNADLSVSINALGNVFSVGGGFVSDLQSRLSNSAPTSMSPLSAVTFAASNLGLTLEEMPEYVIRAYGPMMPTDFAIQAPSLSLDEITTKLQYVPTADGSAALAWELVLRTPDGDHWYQASVDASTGSLVALADWIDDAGYHVTPFPNEHPLDGGVSTVTDPHNPAASPFGWHDTNGVAGAEFTTTIGNNVDAHLDRNADNVADASPARPNGGTALDFSSFYYDPGLEPSTLRNENGAVVNLFYANNMIHDIYYQYGFTEAAGNFQTNNYGKGGAGNDAVQADAQDGGGTDNANFGTPVDGSAPRMQMYEWTSTSPRRDSDLDNGIIIHEYTHGLSNRLTGGPANSSALNNIQSGGMGEGWGDFYGIMLTQRTSDVQSGSHGIGTYVLGQPITGTGIRRFPYSYNMAINPLMWDAYGTSGTTSYGVTRTTAVHRTGEIWCSTLWDLNWLLINKYGFDSNLGTGWTGVAGPGRAGNKLTMKLVMEGMKLQPANPSITQARDAIIAADIALNGGKDLFEIWSAFARRGLGVNAVDGGSSSTANIVADTTMPMFVSGAIPSNDSVVTTSPVSYVITFSAPVDAATLAASDLLVNGQPATGVSYTAGATSATFTFTVDPVVSSPAQQMMQINAGAFNRASDSVAVQAFMSSFYVDATPLVVTSMSPTPNTTQALPFSTIDITFSEPLDPASVQVGDLSITQGTVTSFTLLNSNQTIRFSVGNLVSETTFNVYVAAGAVTDLSGDPNLRFTGGNLTLDYTLFPFAVPLTARNAQGGMGFDGTMLANIQFAGDADNFSIDLDAGQTIDLTIDASTTFRASVTVTGPCGVNVNNSAAANGQKAMVTQVPITTAGTFNIKVSGVASTVGNYSIYARLNQANEAESNGGAANDTLATAQDIDGSFINIGNGISRAAIIGRTDASAASEVEPNDAPVTATLINGASVTPTNFYQINWTGDISSSTDTDYVNIGAMQVGDILTITQSGSPSLRGTNPDSFLRLYRGASTVSLTFDDDSGPGFDAMINRYTITAADTYYVRGYRANSTNLGTYNVNVFLDNTSTAPTTGGTFAAEVESNNTIATANNASTSWRAVNYLASVNGSITSGNPDYFKAQLNAGDIVSFVTRSTSSLSPATAFVDSTAAVTLALEDGTSVIGGAGGSSPIYGYRITTTGEHYYRVVGASGSTGNYTVDAYLTTGNVLPPLPLPKDLYSFSLAAGQSASVAIKNITSGNVDIAILDNLGSTVATGIAAATNVDELIANYTASSAGTYYVQVGGAQNVDHQLIVVRGATFDSEANNSFATAQSLGGANAAIGYIAAGNEDWYTVNLTVGNKLTVSTTTPGGGPGEFVNNLDPIIELYDPSNVLVGGDDNSVVDGRNATLTTTAAATGVYRVRLRGVGATAGEYSIYSNIVTTPAAKIAGYVIGDGTSQRSTVSSITVNFDQAVTLPSNVADAFTLSKQGGGNVTLSGVAVNSPNTSVTLSFIGGTVDFKSLADGRYTLTVLAANVSGPGGNLDGDGNGVGGDDFILVGDLSNKLFRLFGDSNGDGTVAANDFIDFRLALGATPNSVFDFDDDNAVATSDFIQFRLRFGGSI